MNWYSLPPLLGAICVLIIGAFVYFRNKASLINRSFSLFCFFLFMWLISYSLAYATSDKNLASILCRLACTSVNFLFPTLYLFVAAYLNKLKEEKIWVYIFYAVTIILLPFFLFTKLFLTDPYEYYWGYYSKAGPLHPYAIIITVVAWLKGLFLFFDKKMWANFSDIEKNKTKYIIAVYIISSLGAIDYVQKYGIEIYPSGYIFAILFAFVTAYAIVRHQLMSIRIVIKRTLIFAAIFAVAYTALASLTLFLQSGFEKFLATHKLTAYSAGTAWWPVIYLFGVKINVFSIPPFVVSLPTLFLGLFVYLKNKKKSQNIAFLFISLSVFIWLFFASVLFSLPDNQAMIRFVSKMVFVGVTFISITFYHFVTSLLKIDEQKRFAIKLFYFFGLVFMYFLFFTNLYIDGAHKLFWGYYPKANIVHPIAILFFVLVFGNSLFLLYKYIKSSKIEASQRNRIKYTLIAFFVGSIGAVDYIPNYGFNFYPFGYLFIFAMFLITAYAILRHKLLDIEVILKKTLIFGGLFTVVYAVFAFFAFLGQMFFERFVTQNRWISMIPSVLVVTVMLRPLENFLAAITDRYLFQKKYSYKELLRTFTSEVLTVLELDKLIRLTEDKLTEIMKIESCKFVEIGSKSRNDAAFELPISMRGRAIGTLVFGRKKSDEDYTQEDFDILRPLTKALGIAISNAKLFDELSKTHAKTAEKDKMATIGTLAAGMAHEIRNPITTIRNFADYLPERHDDAAFMDKFGKLIPREIDRIESIARSLLEFSSAEDTIEEEDIAIDEPMKTVVSILEPQYKIYGISINCNQGRERHFVKASRIQLQDAFFNILNYILAESHKDNRITIECAVKDGILSLSIRNKDLVVADHIIKDVFEPVSGVHREKRGFGFNLFVAKQLLERNEAVLVITSDNTKGAEFRVDFKNISGRRS